MSISILFYIIFALASRGRGLELRLAADDTVDGVTSCGTLKCAEELDASDTSSIKQLILRKQFNGEVVVADLSQEHDAIDRNKDGIVVNGTWAQKKAEASVILFNAQDCHYTEFICEVISLGRFGEERISFSSGRINSKIGSNRITTPTVEQGLTTPTTSSNHDNTQVAAALQLSAIIQQTQAYLAGRIEHIQDRMGDKLFEIDNKLALMEKSLNQYLSRGKNGGAAVLQLKPDFLSLKSALALATEENGNNFTAILFSLSQIENSSEKSSQTLSNILRKIEQLTETQESSNQQQRPRTCSNQASSLHETKYQVIYPNDGSPSYLCDHDGGWTVIQRRINGYTDFYRDWSSYKRGFGSYDGDFWLGLDQIHNITSKSPHELVINMVYQGKSAHAHYSNFLVTGELDYYRLSIGTYTGTAGDSLREHDNMKFSTFDNDHDKHAQNCAEVYTGAWWYGGCHSANLNGRWGETLNKGLRWNSFSGLHSVTMSEMKIRAMP